MPTPTRNKAIKRIGRQPCGGAIRLSPMLSSSGEAEFHGLSPWEHVKCLGCSNMSPTTKGTRRQAGENGPRGTQFRP